METGGGFGNAIVGHLVMVAIATLISVPLGILAAIYITEFGPETQARRGGALRRQGPDRAAVDPGRSIRVRTWWSMTGGILGAGRRRRARIADAPDRSC